MVIIYKILNCWIIYETLNKERFMTIENEFQKIDSDSNG